MNTKESTKDTKRKQEFFVFIVLSMVFLVLIFFSSSLRNTIPNAVG